MREKREERREKREERREKREERREKREERREKREERREIETGDKLEAECQEKWWGCASHCLVRSHAGDEGEEEGHNKRLTATTPPTYPINYPSSILHPPSTHPAIHNVPQLCHQLAHSEPRETCSVHQQCTREEVCHSHHTLHHTVSTQQHAAARSITQHHAASRNTTSPHTYLIKLPQPLIIHSYNTRTKHTTSATQCNNTYNAHSTHAPHACCAGRAGRAGHAWHAWHAWHAAITSFPLLHNIKWLVINH